MLETIKAMTFDVYGTLIATSDTSLRATETILSRSRASVSPASFYQRWKQNSDLFRRSDTFMSVREILRQSLDMTFKEFNIEADPARVSILFEAIRKRPAYPEAAEVCRRLSKHYTLGILSNTDAELIGDILHRNNIAFDILATSEQSKVYKPHPKIFRDALNALSLSGREVLHVGNSQEKDVLGAKNVDMLAAWINRRGERLRDGIPKPDLEMKDLYGLLRLIE